tara:strand:- start:498 stop:2030 length:1533 start_codon:yes stop_codon:yes gene_type:complete
MRSAFPKLNLSKSLYTKGLQCKKALWLKKYKPQVLTPPSAQIQAVFETGNEVGALACGLFPGGKEVPFKGTSFNEKIALTRQWISEGEKNIYEATFEYDDILVMIDIFHQKEDGSFEIYEVKSSTWNQNKSIDDIYKYIHDVSIQYFVLTGLGYNVSNTFITLLNTDYVRGSEIDINALFTSVKVTEEVLDLNDQIPSNIENFRETLKDIKNEPNIDIGWHCNNPYECDAHEYCWKTQKAIPEYSVFDIFQFNKNAKSMQLYREGITAIEDIPEDYKLSPTQELYVDIWKYQKSIINKEAIKNFVDSLSYPIYHFDFETFNPAIPKFKGLSSFEIYPFQYSIHIEHEDGSLEHKEYLADPDIDPREEIARRMTKDIPKGSFMMAYNISFERGIIKKLAEQFPAYSNHLMSLHDNFVDMHTPFKNKDYLTPEMKGKSGLKIILPILVPEMQEAYKELDMVHHGGEAMSIYQKLANEDDLEMISRYRTSLIEYCKLDTYAMVKILEKLRGCI